MLTMPEKAGEAAGFGRKDEWPLSFLPDAGMHALRRAGKHMACTRRGGGYNQAPTARD